MDMPSRPGTAAHDSLTAVVSTASTVGGAAGAAGAPEVRAGEHVGEYGPMPASFTPATANSYGVSARSPVAVAMRVAAPTTRRKPVNGPPVPATRHPTW